MKKYKDDYQHDDWHTQQPSHNIFAHDLWFLCVNSNAVNVTACPIGFACLFGTQESIFS